MASPSNATESSAGTRLLQVFNRCLPNCERAIELAGRGQERSLGVAEKLALRYNARLCPFCACSEVKVQCEIEKMEAAEKARQASSRSKA